MPNYPHICKKCEHEWDDIYKMSDPVPDTCPSCNEKGYIKRLIGWVAGKVELSGLDHKIKTMQEAKDLRRQVQKDENLFANIVGEDKYHKSQLNIDKLKKG